MDEKKPLYKRLIEAVRGPSNEEIIEKRVSEAVKRSAAGDVLRFSPRAMTFPGGSTRKPYPLGVSYQTLRDFADYYPIARSCIEFRKSQITHLNWSVGPTEVTSKTVTDEKNQNNSKELLKLFRHPSGSKTVSFTNWLKQIMEDLFVIDAVAVYRRRSRGGKIIGYLPIDGASIELVLLHDGTTPLPPEVAYIQKIHGQETARLTSDELLYTMMNPRTHTAYGLAPLETLILTVTTALKSSSYNLAMLTEGNVPEGFVYVPKDIASSRDQLKEWQDSWDAMLAGDPRVQRKLKFLPEGMKYEPTVKAGDMTFEKFEKWLLQNTCFSDDTEVLTDQGWKLFKNLDKTEKIATRSQDGKFEWQKPTDYIEKEIEEDVVHFETQAVDCIVTQDHDMLVKFIHSDTKHLNDKEFKIKAGEIVGKRGYFIPNYSSWEGVIPSEKVKIGDKEIDWDTWTKFMGIWLAEGWAKGSVSGQTKQKTVGVAQMETSDNYLEIKELLEQMPYKWYSDERGFTCWDESLHDYLVRIGNTHTKRIPLNLRDLPIQYLQNLVDWFIKGDGHITETNIWLINSNYELLGDFQEIVQKLGLASNVIKNPLEPMIYRGETWYPSQTYRLSIRQSKHKLLTGHLIPYKGKVYCVRVPNGVLLVRRNGKSLWAGNCSVFGLHPSAIGFNFDINRATDEISWEAGKERSLFPTALFLKEFMDEIVQVDLDHPELQFVWTNINPTNKKEEAEVTKMLINNGLMAIDEWRLGEGLSPTGVKDPFIMTPVGPIFVKDLVEQSDEGQQPVAPYKPKGDAKPVDSRNLPIPSQGRAEAISDLRKWKKAAINDFKDGKPFRNFRTDTVDKRTQYLIKAALMKSKNKEDIAKLFDSFLYNDNSEKLSELYDNVIKLLENGNRETTKAAFAAN